MSAGNSDRSLELAERAMEQEAHLLDSKKAELRRAEEQIEAFKKAEEIGIDRVKKEYAAKSRTIEEKKNTLERDIDNIMKKQAAAHQKIQELARMQSERVAKHPDEKLHPRF